MESFKLMLKKRTALYAKVIKSLARVELCENAKLHKKLGPKRRA